MKKIFLSLPMKNRSDEAIKFTIDAMKRIITAYYPNEEITFLDNFEAGYEISEQLIKSAEHPQFLYLSRALFKMAQCTHIATIDSQIFWKLQETYHGCALEVQAANWYGLAPINLFDKSGEIFFPDLVKRLEEERTNKVCNTGVCLDDERQISN